MATIPRNKREAASFGYKKKKTKVAVKYAKLSKKKDWALIRAGAARSPHLICYYNPKTGNWDDCYEEA